MGRLLDEEAAISRCPSVSSGPPYRRSSARRSRAKIDRRRPGGGAPSELAEFLGRESAAQARHRRVHSLSGCLVVALRIALEGLEVGSFGSAWLSSSVGSAFAESVAVLGLDVTLIGSACHRARSTSSRT